MVLVIGGAGYIGSHMLKLLRERGVAHVAFDNFSAGHREALCSSPCVEGDLNNREDLRRAFMEYPSIDVVMHFAASISVGESVREPAKYWQNNVLGVFNLLEAMRAAHVSKLVFSSTAAVFGEPLYVPIDESHPKQPTSPYGETKLAVERMLANYDLAYGLKSVILRYFNASGCDPDGVLGEDHDPEEHLIPVALDAALGKRAGMKIFGTDYDTPDGTCVRDYVHVLDLAEAHLLAVRHMRQGGDPRDFNLGSGTGYSVREVLNMAKAVSGVDFRVDEDVRRPGDPAKLIASSQAIRDDWGWSPRFDNLRTIVEHAWAWRKAHPGGYGD